MKTIFVYGTFDLLHPGHVSLLSWAKSLGDYLVVGIDTDDRVREKKGSTRPIYNQTDRGIMLVSLSAVDEVRYFDSDESLENLVKEVKPDIIVVGSDWKEKEVVGSQYAGEVRFFDRIGNYSTTNVLESDK